MARILRETTVEERRRILATLFGSDRARRWRRFSLMLGLSVVVATVGLNADSPAVVVGAMLIAPPMTPIMAFGAAVALGSPRKILEFGLAVLLASVGSIALAWLIPRSSPTCR